MDIYVNAVSLINALGSRDEDILKALQDNCAPGIQTLTGWKLHDQHVTVASVIEPLPEMPSHMDKAFDTRNNRLLLKVIEQKREDIDQLLNTVDKSRIAVVMGTSTSGSHEVAQYIKDKIEGTPTNFVSESQEMGDPSKFVATYLGITGPAYTVCTACTSSSRAIISGARMIQAGLVDAAIVGGSDSLAELPINGFDALGVLSHEVARPLTAQRNGITIGEAAGFLILTKTPSLVKLLGYGESSDGYHMSSPDPEGKGAKLAMQGALDRAGLKPEDIEYINLHGTGTPMNDLAETKAVYEIFGDHPWVSSTKNLTGHTLGAAGITDAGLLVLMLLAQNPVQWPSQFQGTDSLDPALNPVRVITAPQVIDKGAVMTNNFAFGGNNTSLIFGI